MQMSILQHSQRKIIKFLKKRVGLDKSRSHSKFNDNAKEILLNAMGLQKTANWEEVGGWIETQFW